MLTYATYWSLLSWCPYPVAYASSFVLGIISGYAINTLFVFRQPWRWRRLLAFPLVHAVNFVAGLGVVWISVRMAGVNPKWAPIVATIVTLPLNFLMTRTAIGGR